MNEGLFAPAGGVLRGEVLIGGRWYDKPERLESRDPATGELLGTVPLCNREDVALAVAEARRAAPGWAGMPVRGRLDLLEVLARLLHREGDALASLVTYENGKPLQESLAVDLQGALDLLAGLVRGAGPRLRPQRVRTSSPLLWGKSHRLHRVPLGVVGVISPWNLPLAIPVGQIALALAAGNTVVFKPSELAPLVAAKLSTLIQRAGLPAGVFNLVTGDRDTGAFLVESGVDGLLFTGSTSTGRKILAALAGRLTRTQMELGGKDAFLVLPDAPFERTVNGAVWNGCFGSGQVCSSSERYYVHRSLYPRFVEAVTERVARLKVGSGFDPETQVGPMISEAQRDKVHRQVQEAVAGGARVLCGGGPLSGPGFFFAPTVLVDVPPGCNLMREETFGPVLPLAPYDDLDQAVALCNDSPYGLSASVWTADLHAGEALARRLEVGSVWVNDASYTHGQASCPWGGVKASGVGRTHWTGALDELTTLRLVGMDRGRAARELWWFPYGKDGLELARAFRELLWERGLGRVGPAARVAVRLFRVRSAS